jgi:hypothetical protein
MKNLLNTLLIVLLTVNLCIKIKVKQEVELGPNLLINGDFSEPNMDNVPSKWRYVPQAEVPGWDSESDDIEIGRGNIYNNQWTTDQICELDARKNYAVFQKVNLAETKRCRLQFKWAARQVALATNGFKLYWNKVLVDTINPADYNIHDYSVDLDGKVGENEVRFEGSNESNSYGTTIDKVVLRCTVGVIPPPDQCLINRIQNGDFSSPNTNGGWSPYVSIPGWKAINIKTNVMEIGRGSIYNTRWGNQQVCELDSHKNSTIEQEITLLKANKCHLEFRYAARSGVSYKSNQLSVKFNNVQISHILPADYEINTVKLDVEGKLGLNTLRFTGEGDEDSLGNTISNVKLFCCDKFDDVPQDCTPPKVIAPPQVDPIEA